MEKQEEIPKLELGLKPKDYLPSNNWALVIGNLLRGFSEGTAQIDENEKNSFN